MDCAGRLAGASGDRRAARRPCHPRTQGKEERFHRTLQAEVIIRTDLRDQAHSQRVFDVWRST